MIALSNVDPTATNKTFPDLMWDLAKNKYPTGNEAQHAEFVRNYVNDIGISLQNYGNQQGYNLTSQFYNDLAWGGLTHWKKRDIYGNPIKDFSGNTILEETPWFKNKYPNLSDRNRILNVISIEQSGKDIGGVLKSKKGKNAGC